MRIGIRYIAQVRLAAGRAAEDLELSGPTAVGGVLTLLAERHGGIRPLLLTEQGQVQPTLLLFLGDERISVEQLVPRYDGEVLTILTPMAGG